MDTDGDCYGCRDGVMDILTDDGVSLAVVMTTAMAIVVVVQGCVHGQGHVDGLGNV